MDNDGDLDLAVGNWRQKNQIFENDGFGNFSEKAQPYILTTGSTYSIAWGDMDGDGDLDLAVGNSGINVLYVNDGQGHFTSRHLDIVTSNTKSVAWGDMDNDGDLDLAVGNSYYERQSNEIFENDGTGNFTRGVLANSESGTISIAWGDMDNDGDLDLVAGNNTESNQIYENKRQGNDALISKNPIIYATLPVTSTANFYASAKIIDSEIISIPFTISNTNGTPIGQIKAYYSLNGGGNWIKAVPQTAFDSIYGDGNYIFPWNVLNSGFFGHSDNVVLKMEALLQTNISNPNHVFTYPNGIQNSFQSATSSSTTFPFRVRGAQIRVLNHNQPVSEAIVYRLPARQSVGALPIRSAPNKPFYTNSEGYLQGREQVSHNDTLFAMAPISTSVNEKYTVYATNIAPTIDSIMGFDVTQTGVQIIPVSAETPLILFNLDISLEWDARQDTAYLAELEANLQRASELLFDWSNGQMALGNITLYQSREHWEEADVQILASNRYRPNAGQGGIIDELRPDPDVPAIQYHPGQLRMGATWNRDGSSVGNRGEDWARTFVHELGHYLLFMDDNYYGFDDKGKLIDIRSCSGVMADPYSTVDENGNNEFHANLNWETDCAQTASHLATERSDWATLRTFYPWLTPPNTNEAAFYGPNRYPLATTNLHEMPANSKSETLGNPTFTLLQRGGGGYFAGTRAQAYLIRPNDRIINLGGMQQTELLARGAQPGDQLCVQDQDRGDYGCKLLYVDSNRELEIVTDSPWQPNIIINPVTSTTVDITVTLEISLPLHAQFYPFNSAEISPAIPLNLVTIEQEKRIFTGQFNLTEPTPNATIHIWADDGSSRYDVVTDYMLGGKPWCIFGRWGNSCNNGAPLLSTDGFASVVGQGLDFDEGEFYILQTANALPEPPEWATVVGQPYRLTKSPTAPDFAGSNIQITYLQREVPSGAGDHLHVYYHNGDSWQRLETNSLTGVAQVASAPVQGEGIYVLMATIVTPPLAEGWNLFAYPDVNARSVNDALASLTPEVYPDCEMTCYTSVYQWQDNKWLLYDQTVVLEHPEFVSVINTLAELHPLQSYWIYATETITPLIQPFDQVGAARSSQIQLPPATFYGEIHATTDFVVGDKVEAQINGTICGESTIESVNNSLAYTIQVRADHGDGCGVDGREITFIVKNDDKERIISDQQLWSNRQACYHPLGGENHSSCFASHHVYLPMIKGSHSSSAKAPDLVVESIMVNGNDIEVTIANVGNTAVTRNQQFWVDLYIDPIRTPTANDTWPIVSTRGAVWGVNASALPLAPGKTLKLTTGDAYYHENLSNFDGILPPDTPVFLQVDSAHTGTTYGAVLETHEILGNPYNNIEVIVIRP